ncbi:MAG: MFS transporter [Acidimicrobiales bacterium]|nr:MAG: MFS transporter [Acidimicrobiales bacterium]
MNAIQIRSAPLRRLWLAVLCGYLALGATLQELPTYMAGRFGTGPALVGLGVGAAFAATAVTRPFAGRAGDSGLARPVVMAGGVITSVGAIGHLLAPNLALLIAVRLIMGAGEAALFSGALPWVLSATSSARRGRVAGWFGLSMWGGLAIGPVLAVAAHQLGGSTAVWSLVIALPLASTVLIASTRRVPRQYGAPQVRVRSWRDIVPAGAGLPGLYLGLAAYGYGTLTALLVLYLTDDRIGGQSMGLTVFAIAFLLTRAAGSPLIDRYGGLTVARLVVLAEIVGLVLLAQTHTAAGALFDVSITGIGLGLVYPSAVAITLTRAHALRSGAAVGAMTSCWDLGILAAGLLGGVIAVHFHYPAAFLAASVAGAGALALTFAIRGSARNTTDAGSQTLAAFTPPSVSLCAQPDSHHLVAL